MVCWSRLTSFRSLRSKAAPVPVGETWLATLEKALGMDWEGENCLS